MKVTLIDAGTGNLRSVFKALESLGAAVALTDDPRLVLAAGRVVLPGVGAFGDFMAGLRQKGLDEAICRVAQDGIPLLGICVGMQALHETSLEMGEHAGLGLVPGRVLPFASLPGLKVPHTGWNQLWPRKESHLFQGLEPGCYAYFNHSYFCAPQDQADLLWATDYGVEFASAIQRDNLCGVQFHPEKSQRVGMCILRNFLSLER